MSNLNYKSGSEFEEDPVMLSARDIWDLHHDRQNDILLEHIIAAFIAYQNDIEAFRNKVSELIVEYGSAIYPK